MLPEHSKALATAHQALHYLELITEGHTSGPEFTRKRGELVEMLHEMAAKKHNAMNATFYKKMADAIEAF